MEQRYIRPPPPPPPSDHHHVAPPPPPPGQNWYPQSQLNQFQFNNNNNNQWGPPPPPPPPGAGYSHHPYPIHPPPYPPPQDWGNTNWGQHPGWEYPPRQDEEDWAAKARAWAASNAAIDNQHPQSHFAPVSRLEGQSPYHDPYVQSIDGHHPDVQSSNPSPGYHQYPVPGAPLQKPSLNHPQEYAAIHSGSSSFVPDEHVPYGAKDGSFGGDSNAVYHHQESLSVSPLVHMQEVPSSYSSITGKMETGDGREKLYKSFPYPTDSSQVSFHDHLPPPPPPASRSTLMEQQHYAVGNHAAEYPIDPSDQPLSFTRRFSFDHEPMMKQKYDNNDSGGPVRGLDPVAAAPSNYSLTSPHLSGTSYPPFPPVLPSAQQLGPSVSSNSSFPGHSTPSFGMMSGPSFQSSVPSIGIGATSGLHPTTVFPGDIYGVLSGSDRPKKAPVPDWLKEEIIKNKAIIASSGPERPTDSMEDEAFDKTPGRADFEDSKSMDSPGSAVGDDEEDEVEAAKTAEVNQEIKRILTEVLLKVTDELFDEIATQVLNEDLTSQVTQDNLPPNHKASFTVPAVPTPKASANVLVAAKAKEVETADESGPSTSISPGDLLGLASYASDDDNDDDDDADNSVRLSTEKLSKDDHAAENGEEQTEFERDSKNQVHGENYKSKLVSNGVTIHHDGIANLNSELRTNGGSSDGIGRSKVSEILADDHNTEGRKTVEASGNSRPNNSVGDKVTKTVSMEDASSKMSAADNSRDRETKNKHDIKDEDTGGSSYVQRGIAKAVVGGKDSKVCLEDERHRIDDNRYNKMETTTDKNNVPREKKKEQGGKSEEKTKESESRKRLSSPDSKMDRKDNEKDRRANDKDDTDRRRERKKDDKEERSRDKRSESGRHRRRRSPSAGSRGRSSKGNSIATRANNSSDESSDDSKRKMRTKKRNQSRSPSPIRSKKRQDSRSPPSKRSHRRHSPFSSLETTRGRRSRSRSPARRRR